MEKTHLRNKERVINFSGAAAGQWKEREEGEGVIFSRAFYHSRLPRPPVHRSPPLNVPVALAQKRGGLNRGRVSRSFNAVPPVPSLSPTTENQRKRKSKQFSRARTTILELCRNFRASGFVVSITDQRPPWKGFGNDPFTQCTLSGA